MNSTEIKGFQLSDEMREKLDKLSKAGTSSGKLFTKEQEFVILEYFHKKNKDELADLLGVNISTLRRHYKRLKKEHEFSQN
jgi:DNA-directed RNA polymerase specialized sigma24 family protein